MSFVVRVIFHAVRITVRAQSGWLTRAVKEAKEAHNCSNNRVSLTYIHLFTTQPMLVGSCEVPAC